MQTSFNSFVAHRLKIMSLSLLYLKEQSNYFIKAKIYFYIGFKTSPNEAQNIHIWKSINTSKRRWDLRSWPISN